MGLQATLRSLQQYTPQKVDIVLLPDGPDTATQQALAHLREFPQLGTKEPLGPPACFNRLAASGEADVLILLESGVQVGPGWLDYLLAALEVDPHHGLAGPSTNRSWNEQAAFPHAAGELPGVARTAQEAAQRFGRAWRTLEPLYSLADFCYVVRREVVAAIGAADEGYGLGPCWEMDYNIRAARAGWRGVWACGAYVYRAPFTQRRQKEEQLRFEASKRRYQDKFCALRLLKQRAGYESHCRGGACEHFAPRDRIQIRLPLPGENTQAPVEPQPHSRQASYRLQADPTAQPAPQSLVSSGTLPSPLDAPLVSCIMPTRNRAELALQAVRYFQQQDYIARELIIVDDGDDDLERRLPDDARLRFMRVARGLSIGAKRNRACEVARGTIIAHWDDDDWYAPHRLSAQVAPLLEGSADITGLDAGLFFDLPNWEFWSCTPELHRRMFVGDVHGGTLVYKRSLWERGARYPDRSLAEDAVLLHQAQRRGARLTRIRNEGLFIYIRHAHNSWAFRCGEFLNPGGWRRAPEPALPASDRAFYATRVPRATGLPLISCIMPTSDRRQFVAVAVEYFSRQDYATRELIVVDDGADAVQDLIPADPRVRYLRLADKRSLGFKRNLACQEARGDIILHWDDDDWMANWRTSYQVENLLQHGADICGLDQLWFYDLRSGQAWQYAYSGGKPWVSGATLCYRKSSWSANPFPEINVGEDTRFIWSNRPKQILPLPLKAFYVALIHSRNTSPKNPRGAYWRSYPADEVRRVMGGDLALYTAPATRVS